MSFVEHFELAPNSAAILFARTLEPKPDFSFLLFFFFFDVSLLLTTWGENELIPHQVDSANQSPAYTLSRYLHLFYLLYLYLLTFRLHVVCLIPIDSTFSAKLFTSFLFAFSLCLFRFHILSSGSATGTWRR
ncbi:hypothetical protein I7I48_00765 [Histoplasma ohiense]|nr:hypothetical protein I7I48_00765 [Histoplasma ohiense (nom. inval.)]